MILQVIILQRWVVMCVYPPLRFLHFLVTRCSNGPESRVIFRTWALQKYKHKHKVPTFHPQILAKTQNTNASTITITSYLASAAIIAPSHGSYCVTRAPLLYFIRSWVALSFKVCPSVRQPWHLSRSPLCAIYKGINALYWPSIINYHLLPPHSVPYWPSTQLHQLVTHSWANWI